MDIIIVGGGKVGYYLLKSLHEQHEVALIDKNKGVCETIAKEFDSMILWGDGTTVDVLRDAGIENANIVVAVTGKDEENIIICQIAKMNFNIEKTIARVNNPKNIEIFKQLGVDKTVCSTEVIANMIEMTFKEI